MASCYDHLLMIWLGVGDILALGCILPAVINCDHPHNSCYLQDAFPASNVNGLS